MTRDAVIGLLLLDALAMAALVGVVVRDRRRPTRLRAAPVRTPGGQRRATERAAVPLQAPPVDDLVVRLPDTDPASAPRVLRLDQPAVPAPRAGESLATRREQLDALAWRSG